MFIIKLICKLSFLGRQFSFYIALDPIWPDEGKSVDKTQIMAMPSLVTATVSEDMENGKKRTKLVIDWENWVDHDHPSKYGYRMPQLASIMKKPRVVFRFAIFDKNMDNKEYYYADISDRLSPNKHVLCFCKFNMSFFPVPYSADSTLIESQKVVTSKNRVTR